jgi:hypothetical protein
MLNFNIKRINKLHFFKFNFINYTKNYTNKNEHAKYKRDYNHYTKLYNKEFVQNFFADPKVEQYLEDYYNIDKCFITQESIDEVNISII